MRAGARTTLRAGLLGSLVVLMSGCASISELANRPAEVVDTERISAIERTAREQGAQVIWLRYPTRPADEKR